MLSFCVPGIFLVTNNRGRFSLVLLWSHKQIQHSATSLAARVKRSPRRDSEHRPWGEGEGPEESCWDCGGFVPTKLFLSLKSPTQKINGFTP